MTDQNYASNAAMHDFQRLRRRAALEEVVSRLTGKSDDLLSYEDVRHKLKVQGTTNRGLRDIPLDAIVGSVGRYTDFSRSFLPRNDSDARRWARVKAGMTDMRGLPPIEAYQIGDAYFVLDGNHRVSVARELGDTHIEALVTEVRTRVPLSAHTTPDDLILKAEHATFLEQTRLDELRPKADLSVTAPGQYQVIEAQINAHQQRMAQEQGREVAYDEAVGNWYDTVYLPVVQMIRDRALLEDFPGRTETDLYVWITEHRATIERELGWDVDPAAAAHDLINQRSPRPERVAARIGERFLGVVRPDAFAPGPPPGQWRRELVGDQFGEQLFGDLLVPISSEEVGWNALDQALEVASKENSRLHGLHIVATDAEWGNAATEAMRVEFERRCAAAGVAGALIVEVGGVTDQICSRARWADLVVVNLAHPPGPQPIARLRNGFRSLVQRCPRPVLAAPGASSPLTRALLAYDGSPKAEEALFVATYLALRWHLALTVVSVSANDGETDETLAHAGSYLEDHGARATYVSEHGAVAPAILKTAAATSSDLIIIGGYGFRPELEVVLGSAVDEVLRTTQKPVLICR